MLRQDPSSRFVRRIELLFLPDIEPRDLVEPREDPSEQAETGLLAPAVGGAIASPDPCRFLRSGRQSDDQVADEERKQDALH
jgi:hypothetical protein